MLRPRFIVRSGLVAVLFMLAFFATYLAVHPDFENHPQPKGQRLNLPHQVRDRILSIIDCQFSLEFDGSECIALLIRDNPHPTDSGNSLRRKGCRDEGPAY
jgi:hypothetical protein